MSKMQKVVNVADNMAQPSFLGKVAQVASAPQRYASQRLAEAIGIVPKKSSEENFQEIAQAVAEKISQKTGINPDSPAANAVKALGVAGAEVFADPLGFVPVGKVMKAAKGAKKVITPILQQAGGRAGFKAAEKAKALQSAVEKLRQAKSTGTTVGAQTGVNMKSMDALQKEAAAAVPKEPQVKYEKIADFIKKTKGE